MFALDTPPGLPFTTRSSLQALLKSRGAVSENKGNAWIPMKDKALSSNFALNCEEINSLSQDLGSNSIPHLLHDSDLRNGDSNGDFSYSQKLFHIDDGNLYSIFSPLQGRSYGMKPSFLRKQKCTVQECHGRGRKIHRKGLKFHNFLPSESVTSEKDNNFHNNQWKVHSECKLREEHGTKQIMVSNWSRNVNDSQDDGEKSVTATSSSDFVLNPHALTPTPNESIYSYPVALESNMESESACSSESKYSFLNSLLHSVSKSQLLYSSESKSDKAVSKSNHAMSLNVQKRRRKPDQTRKVVPYTKYLSLIEEGEGETETCPLDLSCHSNSSGDILKVCENDIDETISCEDPTSCESNSAKKFCSEQLQIPGNKLLNNTDHVRFLRNVPSYLYPQPNILPPTVSDAQPVISKINRRIHEQYPSSTSSSKSKERRKSQRSVIKQKLEDTFRQNGFLVKTKQVSDGEATFCKFRQLRKYTRYYLKSWQQHLPDEVNKMWKGFLPPKTVLPPASSTARSTLRSNTP